MSEYSRALLNILAMERSAMINDGLKPIAVRLTSPEVQAIRTQIDLPYVNREGFVMQVFGLRIEETNDPVRLGERFITED